MRKSFRLISAGFLALATVAAGCAQPGRPRMRLGALPCPGFLNNYIAIDPGDLGRHRYTFALWHDEVRNGIIYTCDAGFLDVAHMRLTVDWAWHFQRALREKIASGGNSSVSFVLREASPSLYHIELTYPQWWDALTPEEREGFVDELSIRCALELVWLSRAWHEFLTWYGYKSTGVFPEGRSAFTYDDTMSHIIGMRIAGRALRECADGGIESGRAAVDRFEAHVTRIMIEELERVRALSGQETDDAMRRVERIWWRGGSVLVRHLDLGLDDRLVEPMLVPMPACGASSPQSFALTSFDDVLGRDCTGFFDVKIEPRVLETWRIRRLLPDDPDRIAPGTHFPLLLQDIQESLARAGEHFAL